MTPWGGAMAADLCPSYVLGEQLSPQAKAKVRQKPDHGQVQMESLDLSHHSPELKDSGTETVCTGTTHHPQGSV